VDINWDVLGRLDPGKSNRVDLPVFDGNTLEIVLQWSEYRSDDDFTWFGEIAGVAASDVIFVRYKDVIQVEIRDYESQARYQVSSRGGTGHALRDLSWKGRESGGGPWCGSGDPGPMQPEFDPKPRTQKKTSDPIHQVDVMTCCTAEALAGYGSANAFVAESQAAVADFNLRHSNSFRWNLVTLRLVAADATVASSYNETTGNDGLGTDFDNLTGSLNGLEEVATVRDLYRADLVALIRESSAPAADGTCCTGGLAWTPDLGGFGAVNGFSVNARNWILPLVGDTFAHEIGHNFSLVHDVATYRDQENDPNAPILPDRHGHREVCVAGCILADYHEHTTMAYGEGSGCGSSVLIPMFSTPETLFNAGQACPDYTPGKVGESFAAWILEGYGAPSLSQYKIGSEVQWTQPGALGSGSFLDPRGSVADALDRVQGGYLVGVVRARAGAYNESFLQGGTAVLDQPGRIEAYDGNIVVE